MAVAGPLSGKLTGAKNNQTSSFLPGNAESTQVMDLQQRFGIGSAAAVIVYQRASGITAADRAKAAADTRALTHADGVTRPVVGPLASRDGQALQTVVQISMAGGSAWTKLTARMDAIGRIARSGY